MIYVNTAPYLTWIDNIIQSMRKNKKTKQKKKQKKTKQYGLIYIQTDYSGLFLWLYIYGY